MDKKFLIVVFDALRPEFVTSRFMPNLHQFQASGVRYRNSRSIFFTETRVNQTAVVTGCTPGRNGIVANYFLAADVWPDRLLNTGVEAQLKAAFNECDSGLINVPTLGQRLASAGFTFATLSAGTAGGGRLINHSAEANGSFRLAMRAPEASQPPAVLDEVLAAVGEMPEYQRPATEWISWAVKAYLDYVLPSVSPDVMLLWLCEPDETFHYHGIGSQPSLQTLRHADAEFGKVLERQREEIDSGQLQIVAMSDHGQISLVGEPVDIVACLRDAGFRAASEPGANIDCVVHVHNGGGIWVVDDDAVITERLVHHLLEQPWCGPIFTRGGIAGSLSLEEVCLDHPRAPTIAITCKADDSVNEFGIAGSSAHDAPYPVGGGCHGGLSSYELSNFLSMSGAAFKSEAVIDIPASNIDITPTILAAMGINAESGFDGRVLHEAFLNGVAKGRVSEVELVSQNANGSRTHLSLTDYAGVQYLNRAWVE